MSKSSPEGRGEEGALQLSRLQILAGFRMTEPALSYWQSHTIISYSVIGDANSTIIGVIFPARLNICIISVMIKLCKLFKNTQTTALYSRKNSKVITIRV